MADDRTELVNWRRLFHRLAEPGWLECRTTEQLIRAVEGENVAVHYGKAIYSKERLGLPAAAERANYTKNLHLDLEKAEEVLAGYTGLIAVVDTGKPGPHVGFRFDIDALPLTETHAANHLPRREHFQSEHEGFMHACGHDGHMAIGVCLTRWLAREARHMTGKFVIVFQPAEEGVRGADALAEGPLLKYLDYFFGLHIGMGLGSGKICVGTTDILATEKIDAEFIGQSAHAGAHPEEGRHAILAAAMATLGLHTLPQDANGLARVNVGQISGGSSRNIVANQAKIALEIRGSNERVMTHLKEGANRVLEGAALQFGCQVKTACVGRADAWEDKNHHFHEQVARYCQKKGYQLAEHSMKGSEDVALFLNRVAERGGKVMHLMVGSDLKSAHHQEGFDFNEDDLLTGLHLVQDLVRLTQEES